jgi:hypothetical protein
VAADLGAIAEGLFTQVMAPLVLGGPLRPVHAIGARSALALGEQRIPADRDLASRVDVTRVRRARRLVAVDTLPDPNGADWAIAAAINDVLQAASVAPRRGGEDPRERSGDGGARARPGERA